MWISQPPSSPAIAHSTALSRARALRPVSRRAVRHSKPAWPRLAARSVCATRTAAPANAAASRWALRAGRSAKRVREHTDRLMRRAAERADGDDCYPESELPQTIGGQTFAGWANAQETRDQ